MLVVARTYMSVDAGAERVGSIPEDSGVHIRLSATEGRVPHHTSVLCLLLKFQTQQHLCMSTQHM